MDFSQIIALLADLQVKLADVEAFSKAQYDKGFADGVASVVVPPVDPDLQAKLDEALAKISDLQAQVDALPAKIQEAVMAENARVLAIVKAEELDLEAKIALV